LKKESFLENSSEIQFQFIPISETEEILPTLPPWKALLQQCLRFGLVGIVNAGIDLVVFNLLIYLFPTKNSNLLLLFNVFSYGIGAVNSFFWNKYWTFRHQQRIDKKQVIRFAVVNVIGICCNSAIVWLVAQTLHPFVANMFLLADTAKIAAIVVTAIISFLCMRLWVFATSTKSDNKTQSQVAQSSGTLREGNYTKQVIMEKDMHLVGPQDHAGFHTNQSLSVILPAHNEEAIIAQTVQYVLETLTPWVPNFEVIVINDGSKDNTKAIVDDIAVSDARVRLVHHEVNRGYGAALASGFASVTKELALFMDADGQFDIRDLAPFLSLIEHYDAVLGYRIDRQDTLMRKLNAQGWKMLTRMVFGLRVRDVDCAFKLYRASFFEKHPLETSGAMINTEILYKFKRAGYTYTEVGVRHLPRRSGKATGAKLSVVFRAFKELTIYAYKWHQEERRMTLRRPNNE
jgi:putative flippase GtrA